MRNWITGICLLCCIGFVNAQGDIFAMLDGPRRCYSPVKSAATNFIFPFRQVGGLVILKGSVFGEEGSFILDTGAPTLVLNDHKRNIFASNRYSIVGIGGQAYAKEELIEDLSIGNYKSKPMDAILTDMTHLEKVLNQKIKGLLGFETIRDFELLINYRQRLVELIAPNNKSTQEFIEVVGTVPIDMRGHFPVIKVKIGDRDYHFGIDSGAESNIINSRFRYKLRKQNKKGTNKKMLQGIDSHKSTVYTRKLKKMEIAGMQFRNMEFIFTDISHLNEGGTIKIDGILGYPFLKRKIFSINYSQEYLALWDYLPEYKTRPGRKQKEEILAKNSLTSILKK